MVWKHSCFIRFNVYLICRSMNTYVEKEHCWWNSSLSFGILDQYESSTGAALVLDALKVIEI